MIVKTANLNLYYGSFHALKDIDLSIKENLITGIIGPSGCGKSTFLRCLNRMNDTIPGTKLEGQVNLMQDDIYHDDMDLAQLRQKVCMVFQKPYPFPKSVFDNVAYGP